MIADMTGIRWAALSLVLAVSLAASPGGRQQPAAPMNVVVLVIDDTRWDSIGAAGNRIVQTPHLDRLASEGIRFTQARVTTSICMASRASLLTGQYMSRHGIIGSGAAHAGSVREDISRPAAGRRVLDRLRRQVRRRPAAAGRFRLLRAYQGRTG